MDTLHIRVVAGIELRNPNWTGKADPYVVIKHGDAVYKTKTHSGGGKNPHWNEEFEMKADRFNPVYLEAWDNDGPLSGDDRIGLGEFDISSIYDSAEPVDTNVQIKLGSKNAGSLRLVIEVKKVGMVADKAAASTAPVQGVVQGVVQGQVVAPQQPGIVYGQPGVAPVQQPNTQMFTTVVPPGHGPGMQVPVNVSGQQFMVPVPPGFGPGMQFQFRVPTGEIGKNLFTQAINPTPIPYGGPVPGQYGAPAPQYGAPGQVQQFGAPPPQYGAPGQVQQYGAPPPQQYGATGQVQQYGAPPPQQYGAPGQVQGYGAPPPQQYGQPGYPPRQF